MLNSIRVAATGLYAQDKRMQVSSNNLANANTTGFKKARAEFDNLLYINQRTPGMSANSDNRLPSGLHLGTGVKMTATKFIHTQGNLETTDNQLDIAIEGNGFLQVLLPDGEIGYTRNGSLTKNAVGQLVNQEGLPIVPDIVIPDNTTVVNISSTGEVSVSTPGQNEEQLIGQLLITRFANPSGLSPRSGNLFTETGSSGEPINVIPSTDGTGQILQGALETSNVNTVDELVKLIEIQRNYEQNANTMKRADEMMQTANQTLG